MAKKRLAIDLEETQHRKLAERARKAGTTVANYVRTALQIPLEHQGVKSVAPGKTKAKSSGRGV